MVSFMSSRYLLEEHNRLDRMNKNDRLVYGIIAKGGCATGTIKMGSNGTRSMRRGRAKLNEWTDE